MARNRDRSPAAVARAWVTHYLPVTQHTDETCNDLATLVRAIRRECAGVALGQVKEWLPDMTDYARGRVDAHRDIRALNRAPRRGR